MKLYRIKRVHDGRFYRNKSKFTLHGTYFRLQQIKGNIDWVKLKSRELELISYNVDKEMEINISDTEMKDILKIIDRDNKINEILKN
tara:strand:+ start:2410 stop:2670 length:261 start_codon:yes stop_codon:yes gene_type:complete